MSKEKRILVVSQAKSMVAALTQLIEEEEKKIL
jgi:hypothetical protein